MGGDMYFASTAVVTCEVLKLLVSFFLLMKDEAGKSLPEIMRKKVFADPYDMMRLSVPAGLYTVQNNLAYYAMGHLDAATYQLLYQLKILTTALFSVLLLKKTLSARQWASLTVLCAGVGLVQTSSSTLSGSDGNTTEADQANSLKGLAAVIAACCSSGLAGVYFEMVLKNAKTSLWVRNIQLGLLGLGLGLLPVAREAAEIHEKGFFFGYTRIVWCVVLLQAMGGLLVAVVVKYADNILKGFATSLSILVSCVASYFVFNSQVNARFVCGASLVLYAVYVYGSNPPLGGKGTAGLMGGKPTGAALSSSSRASSSSMVTSSLPAPSGAVDCSAPPGSSQINSKLKN